MNSPAKLRALIVAGTEEETAHLIDTVLARADDLQLVGLVDSGRVVEALARTPGCGEHLAILAVFTSVTEALEALDFDVAYVWFSPNETDGGTVALLDAGKLVFAGNPRQETSDDATAEVSPNAPASPDRRV